MCLPLISPIKSDPLVIPRNTAVTEIMTVADDKFCGICRLLITVANSLDTDQVLQNVGPWIQTISHSDGMNS